MERFAEQERAAKEAQYAGVVPVLADVLVENKKDVASYICVSAVWDGVDRPNTGGYSVPNMALARRLERAMRAGAVYDSPRIAVDVYGQTYVAASSARRVMGKYLSSDLRKLGF